MPALAFQVPGLVCATTLDSIRHHAQKHYIFHLIFTLLILCVHAPAPQHNAWKSPDNLPKLVLSSQDVSSRRGFRPSGLAANTFTCHQAILRAIVILQFFMFYFTYLGILLIRMPTYHTLQYCAGAA